MTDARNATLLTLGLIVLLAGLAFSAAGSGQANAAGRSALLPAVLETPWCAGDPDDEDADCAQDSSDACPGTAIEDVQPNTPGYSWGDGYYDGSGVDEGGVDSYGCSRAQIDDDDYDHLCDSEPFVLNDRCFASFVDSCPGTPAEDLPPSTALYSWGDGYLGGGSDSGGLDSYGCSLSQISDDDRDHYCDSSPFEYNDRCWELDNCPDSPDAEYVDSYGCNQSQVDTDGDDFCNPGAPLNDWCYSGEDACPALAEDGQQPNPSDGCPADVTSTIEVRKIVLSWRDTSRFNLLIDGYVEASAVRSGGSTGPIQVEPGTHTVSETAVAPASLSGYLTTISCYATDGSTTWYAGGAIFQSSATIDIGPGEDASCTITNLKVAALQRRWR